MRLRTIALACLLLASCNRGGKSQPTPTPTPGAPADREEVYLQLDIAVSGDVDPGALLSGRLTPGEALGGGVRWKPVATALPTLAAAGNPVTADVYDDPGFVSVAFRGAAALAPGLLDGELGGLLSAVAARPESRGASLYRLDDRHGSVDGVLGVAGHDAGEAAMALLDAYAPQLELSYAPEGMAEEGEVDRSALTAKLRSIPDVESDLKRANGARFVRDGGTVRVLFAADTDTRALASMIVTRLGTIAAPRVATSGTSAAPSH